MPAAWAARVPVAAATVLALDLLLQDSSLDLSAAAEIVLADVGATLQVLRLAGCNPASLDEAPFRIEDCLANLDSSAWFSAIASQTLSREPHVTQLNAIWQHSRLVAQYAAVIAESLDGIPSESAYLVGLLHEVETISLLLENTDSLSLSEEPILLEQIVPTSVLTALAAAKERGSASTWRYVLSSAHALASAMPQFVPSAGRAAN